jgi:X-Pro dipeptidyl-peptidase
LSAALVGQEQAQNQGSALQRPQRAVPVFVDGQAQIVEAFNNPDEWFREHVWVETEFDSDRDGWPDRMHVDITRPAQTATEWLKVAVIYESSPYYGGRGSGGGGMWDPHQELGAEPPERRQPTTVRPPRDTSAQISASQVNTWVPRGFAVIHSESPGTGLSQGCPTVGGPNESLAPKAVIDWLNGRARGFTAVDSTEEVFADWCTGKVGMTGTSYNGTLPLAAATTGVAGLEAIIPVSPNTSYYHYYRSNGLVRHPGGYMGEDIDVLYDSINSGNLDVREVCNECVKVGDMYANFDRVHGDYNEFWAGRDYINALEPLDCAVLMAHGFNDWNVVPEHSVRIYEALKAKNIPLMCYFHQGGHGGAPPMSLQNKFFSRFLYGVRNGVEDGPKAWIVREDPDPPNVSNQNAASGGGPGAIQNQDQDQAPNRGQTQDEAQAQGEGRRGQGRDGQGRGGRGRGQGRGGARGRAARPDPTPYADYPHPDARPVLLSLQPGGRKMGGLGLTSGSGQKETLIDDFNVTGAQLAAAESSENRLLFASAALSEPVHLSGTAKVTIRLSCSKPACNLSVWLVSLPWTNSQRMTDNLITRGWADPQNYKSLTQSEPLVPGKFYEMTFPLQPDDQIIAKGERIGMMIFASDRDFTLWPEPSTELTVDLDATKLELPVVGGIDAWRTATATAPSN